MAKDPTQDITGQLGEDAWSFTNNPAWNGGNIQQATSALEVFKKTFKNVTGNDPTAEDLKGFARNALYPSWNAPGDLAYTDQTALANNYIQNNYDLEKLRQQKGQTEAPGQYGAVDEAFQGNVGRAATKEEKDHFGKMLASGELDAYGLSEWLKQLPENVKKQDEEFRKNLSTELQGQDSRYFNEQIMPGIGQSFAKQGRSFDSSAYAQALAQAAQGQNRQRESFLSGITANQYEGNKTNAYNAYLNSIGRTQQTQDYSRARYDALSDQGTQRLYDTQDYNMQKAAYDDYLKRYGKRSSGMGGGIGSLVGLGAGAAFAAPTGGMSIPMGAMLGSSIGGAGGSIWDSSNR